MRQMIEARVRNWMVVTAIVFAAAAGKAARGDLILYYPFNEGAGTTTANATAVSGADLQLQDQTGSPAALWAPGITGKAGDFAFDNSAANLGGAGGRALASGDIQAADALRSLTITGWYYHPSGDFGAVHAYLVSDITDQPSAFTGYSAMFRSTGGVLRFDAETTGPNSASSASYAQTNGWVFFAVTYDGGLTSNNLNYYVGTRNDSVTLVSTATLNQGTIGDNTAPFTVGNTSDTLTNAFHGYLDEIRLYGSKTDSSGVLSLGQLEGVRTSVPEPAWGLAMAGAFLMLVRRRRG